MAEVLVEAAPLAVGEELFFLGATTGMAEQRLEELHGPDGTPAQEVSQGRLCAIRTRDRSAAATGSTNSSIPIRRQTNPNNA